MNMLFTQFLGFILQGLKQMNDDMRFIVAQQRALKHDVEQAAREEYV